jgi:hypothetical protein
MNQQVPLIHTSKGNLPISDLRHEVAWRVNGQESVIFVEKYFLDEEVVKESTHVCILTGVDMNGAASI